MAPKMFHARWGGRLSAALLCFGLVAAGLAKSSQSAVPPELDVAPFVSSRLAPGIHLLTTPKSYAGPAIGNVTLIEQNDGLVVIDSGLAAAHGRAVVRYARAISSKPIKAVAITHWHNDHPQGVSAIRDSYPGVRIIATQATESGMLGPEANAVGYRPDPRIDAVMRDLIAQAKTAWNKRVADPAVSLERKERARATIAAHDQFFEDYRGTYIVPPTETFRHRLDLADPKRPVRLEYLGRANTNGDLVAWLPRQQILVSGDIVVSPVPYGFDSYPSDWLQVLVRIRAMKPKILVPGHGEPQSDLSYVDKLLVAIADVRKQVIPLARAGHSLEQIRRRVDFNGSIALFERSNPFAVNTDDLFFQPMTTNVYKEALGRPIVPGSSNPRPAYTHDPPRAQSRRWDY